MEELNRLARSIPNSYDLNSQYVEYGPDGLPGNNREIIKLFRVHDYLYRHDVEDYDKHLADDLLVRCMTAFGHKDIARKMQAALVNNGQNYYRQKRNRSVVDTPIVRIFYSVNF
jgi:hypothetical protein